MPKFQVCAAFYDADTRAVMEIEAESLEAACAKAIEKVEDGTVAAHHVSYDPGPTFILGIVEGDGHAWSAGMENVPDQYTEDTLLRPHLVSAKLLIAEAERRGRAERALSGLSKAMIAATQTALLECAKNVEHAANVVEGASPDPVVLVADLWHFIENYSASSPERQEAFFALRERVREMTR